MEHFRGTLSAGIRRPGLPQSQQRQVTHTVEPAQQSHQAARKTGQAGRRLTNEPGCRVCASSKVLSLTRWPRTDKPLLAEVNSPHRGPRRLDRARIALSDPRRSDRPSPVGRGLERAARPSPAQHVRRAGPRAGACVVIPGAQVPVHCSPGQEVMPRFDLGAAGMWCGWLTGSASRLHFRTSVSIDGGGCRSRPSGLPTLWRRLFPHFAAGRGPSPAQHGSWSLPCCMWT